LSVGLDKRLKGLKGRLKEDKDDRGRRLSQVDIISGSVG
jgi:hypothetical protein